ncbi:hypothetical protein PtrSN002B_010942 [Pyrenophora tritici-repentis]|uniref:Uncharacterized protein n=1 Tax=Pyrenophora tritici-repentis TaxID=45151 RepID=A0A2W1F8A8_9PLEO|nr:hypothetical protein PtrV1_00708 [Pyrenophora tritici-repentis]KAF7453421.1 hypothetical protein A1F99_006790 [Pyrenophora tritici-repentis]KAF7576495.1 hypothetical protein PtrM4_007350 [Pyrenophora tritici-repentis]KAG9387175.1 hypothetical protein A1F94_000067 [Pyrenophora tritici-repentis]KAI0573874.1 hypothetical protein Alg215_08918 [Pyrenophora tritici-repentis]
MPSQPDDLLLSVSSHPYYQVASTLELSISKSPGLRDNINITSVLKCRKGLRIYIPPSPGTAESFLQSSLRNVLATFGANSKQYRDIKLMVDEYTAKLAMERLSISSSKPLRDDGCERMHVN